MKRSLTLHFAQPGDFIREYQSNLSVGGAVVACDVSCELREIVDVAIHCGFCDASETVEAEVVFCDPVAGTIAVQFLQPAAEVRAVLAPIEALAREAGSSVPPAPEPPTPDLASAASPSPLEVSADLEDLDVGASELDGIDLSEIDIDQLGDQVGEGLEAFEIDADPQQSALPDPTPEVEPATSLGPPDAVESEAGGFQPVPTEDVEAVLDASEAGSFDLQVEAGAGEIEVEFESPSQDGQSFEVGDFSAEDIDVSAVDFGAPEGQAQTGVEAAATDAIEFTPEPEAAILDVGTQGQESPAVEWELDPNDASATGMSLQEPLPAAEAAPTPIPARAEPEPEPQPSVPWETGPDGIPNAMESVTPSDEQTDLEVEAFETGEFEIQFDDDLGVTEDLPQVTEPGEEAGDRRIGERATARVPVRVDSNHISFEGRTRDLSDNGVLISVDGTELPVGRQVQLSLTHPETREEINVSGVVARHVEGQGTVAAVGVAVEGDASERERFEAFVRDVQQVDSKRRASGINGAIEELGIANLLQMLCQSSDRGTLTLRTGQEEGVIAFESGYLRYARLGTLRSKKAFARMLEWTEGEFDFIGQVDALSEEDEPVAVEAALLDAMRARDEAGRGAATALDPSTRLAVDMGALAQEGSDLDKTQEAVIDLAAAGFTVRKVLDIIPEPDSSVIEAIEELRMLGIVQVQES